MQTSRIMPNDASWGSKQNGGGLLSPSHLGWQIGVLLGIWLYLWSLHAGNDGLWFQGDAPRHAANGFFWIDYLRDFTLDAKDYALRYYARYPVIDPAPRPPLFYLLEGVAFTVLGPSPYVAKGLVLCFSLVGSLYLMAWLRRWIAEEAGCMAGLLLLLPAVTQWSHAIMLNIPALALSLGALYHARGWLEASKSRGPDLWLAAAFTVSAILTYYPAGIVVFVICGWIVVRGRWNRLLHPRSTTIFAIILGTAVLLPLAWLIARWAPTHLGWVLPDATKLARLSNWTYYPRQSLQICNLHLLLLSVVGLLAGAGKKRWRREALMLLTWLLVVYVVLSILHAKDLRYALFLCVPFIGLCAIAVITISQWLGNRARTPGATAPALTAIATLSLLVFQGYLAAQYHVPSIRGYPEVVSFLERVAPEEPVFYDGYHAGIFTFYVRANDEGFRRRVVVGDKLLYAYAVVPGWQQQDFVGSPDEVIDVLRTQGGCRWLAIEIGSLNSLAPMQYLRQAVKTPAFELVKSFPIDAARIDRIDVYRMRGPVATVETVELPFPTLGPNVKYCVRPIPPRHSGRHRGH